MDNFSHPSCPCSYDDNMMSRDLGELEELEGFESFSDPGLPHEDDATYRGLAFEEDWFDGNHGLGRPLEEQHQHEKPGPFSPQAGPILSKVAGVATATGGTAPVLTDAAGFVSRHQLFCEKMADVDRIKEACVAACEAHDCVKERPGSVSGVVSRFSHFSRAHFHLAFEVRVWVIPDDRSCCMKVLGECPARAGYVVEFQKLDGCSSRWLGLFASIGTTLLDKSASFFFGKRPSPAPSLNFALDDDDDDDNHNNDNDNNDNEMEVAASEEWNHQQQQQQEEGVALIMRMLSEGSLESQHAAVSAMVQHAVTKQACDQLVESGFMEAAFRIAGDPLSYTDMVPSQLMLLRCILLVVSSVVTLSGKSAVAEGGMGAFVTSLHTSNPHIFTREHAPLLEAL